MSKPREKMQPPRSAGFEYAARTTPMGIEPEPEKKKPTTTRSADPDADTSERGD